MNVIIDTSSLLAFVRNYLPFDKDSVLKNLLQEKFERGELILVDKVYLEAKDISNKIISKELEFLIDKSKHKKTTEIFPSQKFFNMLEHQFCNQDVRKLRRITDVEFELEKRKHLETPDCSIILYALQHMDILTLINHWLCLKKLKLKMMVNFLKRYQNFVIY